MRDRLQQHQTMRQDKIMNAPRGGIDGMVEVGQAAPEFALPDQNGAMIKLADFRGSKNVVLIFYPGDNTPICAKQLCAVRDGFEQFESLETVVLGVNPWKAESHRKFVEKQSLPFKLLVDADKAVASAYGCRGWLAIKRTVYGIDKNGIIVLARRGRPSNEEILGAFVE
jgi:peroxiredoxin Q/BCP